MPPSAGGPTPDRDTYRTVAAAGVHEIEVRRSRFLCALAPVDSAEAAREVIAERRRAEPAARHHCHAFVLDPDGRTQRSSDDGEPAGTAGTPMLEVLRRRGLTGTVAVVSRHFGGVLLGAGGLIRAYGQAVADALDVVGTVEYRRLNLLRVSVDYGRAGRVEGELHSSKYRVTSTSYDDAARFEVGVRPDQVADFRAWLADLTGGSAAVEAGGEDWVRGKV
ncbi:YigZ family protein [Amycolatopsis magusensis]|uniref:YigZ family protein n=1 Tax=Amycolatopsis magusensis TaxID=882444 RepID=A0ABS4PKK6_9PSEU|nr:YigZ family protein [Amycolatopsis magusensis]MBP2179378.1 putative YigZ family protein [Amycolatopsis magusensis]